MSAWTSALLADNPLAFWRKDDPSGTVAVDVMAFQNGTYVGSPILGAASLLVADANPAVTYNGSSQYTTVTGANIWRTTGYSVEFWCKGAAQSDARIWAEGNSTNATPIFSLGTGATTTSKLRCFLRTDATGSPLNSESTAVCFDNLPHHIVFTDNNGVWQLYVDGVADISGSYTPATTSINRASIAALLRASASNWFAGTVDEVAIYTTILNQARVTAHFDASSAPDVLGPALMVARSSQRLG